jgi:class 3 adenylate cyclase/tetratricopeptide (TPR) repeat protein
MRCPRCQTDNRSGARFCHQCGAGLEAVCAQCGAQLRPGSKFCDSCGTRLDGAAAAPRFASPESYTPRHLAERILTSRSAIEGERKQVTVLFADLKGSMELLAERDPEEARALLDPVLHHMMAAVHRFEGTVNQVLGVGIMAIFGAPLALEEHALRACYAALTMQALIRMHAEAVRTAEGVPVQIRVGLNSGEVLVRAIGNDLHMDYSAVGQTTHLAHRMEQRAVPGTILMTADTKRLVEGYVNAASLGPVPVKGLAEPIEVFQLLGAEFSTTRLQVARTRGLSRFVGRQREIEGITVALRAAAAGRGQIVALFGEPGVGKSRVVWEFMRSEATAGWLILESRSVSYGRATAYGPVRDLLGRYFEIEDRDDAAARRARVQAKIASLDGGLQDAVDPILTVLDALPQDSPFLQLDPLPRKQRLLDAITRLFVRQSQAQPLILIFEDLHWIDSETQAVLDRLTESVPATRILLLVNYRPEYHHSWGSRSHYTQLRVDPLAPDSADELLRTLVGGGPDAAGLSQFLIQRTEGNPFFLEESVRALAETHVLVGEPGAYRLAKPLETIQIPPTVQAVLAARIDRLPADKKLLLQNAAVIGKDVPIDLLAAVAGEPPAGILAGLAYLQAGEFLYETSLFPEHEFTFKHALTHEVTYAGLLQERRRTLHAQIVEAMERLPAERVAQQIERLAQHAFRGEVWDKAVRYLRRAGLKASGQSAHRQAVGFFEQALAALAHRPESREALEVGVDLRFDLRNALFALGELDRILDYLREATALAQTLGDQRRIGWVHAYLTHYFWRVGDHARAIESGLQALAIADALGDFALQTTNVNLGLAYYALGDYASATRCLRTIIAALHGERLTDRFGWAALPAVTSRAYLCACLAELGDFAEGTALGQEAIRIAEAANHPFSAGQALLNLAVLHLRKGEVAAATALLERGAGLGGVSKVSALSTGISAALGYAYALAGRVEDGIRLLEAGVAQAEASRITARHSLWVTWLAEAYLLLDRLDDAGRLADRALALSREHHERANMAYALRIAGEIAARSGPRQGRDADELYRAGISLASELGMRPLVARCIAGLAAWYRRSGRPADAAAEEQTAASMLHAMHMTASPPLNTGERTR